MSQTLKVGDAAPEFELMNQDKNPVKLSDFRGKKKVVLLFYPMDFSPVCTEEHCAFGPQIGKIKGSDDAVVFGINCDHPFSHAAFKKQYNIPYDLLSDVTRNVSKAYNLFLGETPFNCSKRGTVVISKDGKIAYWHEQPTKEARKVDDIAKAVSRIAATLRPACPMVNIGPIQLDTPFCQAGLAGYSDRAMRLVARRHGCPYAVTEALLDTVLCNGGLGLRRAIDINDEDHPVAGQLIGSGADTMSCAAQVLFQAGYDVIDLNFACPVKKIRNKARGGHMLLDVPRAISILKAVRDVVPSKIPTTISLRRTFDDSPEAEDRFYKIVESAWDNGYAAIRVHGRTVDQKYLGAACWKSLRSLKKRYPNRTIIGSGDVFTAEDAVRMLHETGVDIVWIARGAIGNPWIFDQARALLRDDDALQPPGIYEQREALREHFTIAMQIHGEQLAGRRMRKMGIKYSRFHPMAIEVKSQFINVRSLRDWTTVLDRFYGIDGPGTWPDARAADEVNENTDPQNCDASLSTP